MAPDAPLGTPDLRALWLDDLIREAPEANRWLWQGYLARGSMTLLTSQWKAGKTTLLSVLLARLGAGGELAGLPVAPGRAVVVSEEEPALWRQRAQHLAYGNHICWLCRPFGHKPTSGDWQALIDRLAQLGTEHQLTLAVLDPLASLLPGGDENSASSMLAALLPLRQLTNVGMSVLLLHHPRKKGGTDGLLSRGSGALSGHVDVLIEMNWCLGADPDDRRRRLRAFSRFQETPTEQVIELDPTGTNYIALGDAETEAFGRFTTGLNIVLTETRKKLTRPEILTLWPPEHEKPAQQTLWRLLMHGAAEGILLSDGKGTRKDPFRYWLPGQEEVWQRDPLGLENMPKLDPWRV